MTSVRLLPFIAVAIPLVLAPGASTAVVLRNSVAGGTRAGVCTLIGVNAGSLCYGLLTAFGFALALRRWPSAWTVVRAGGVAYLSWLGVQSLRRALRASAGGEVNISPGTSRPFRALYEGFLTNLLNPAVAAFYLVLVPQFIPQGSPFASSALVLTGVHISIAASWHAAWALAGAALARGLSSHHARQILEGVTGAGLLLLAAMLLVR